jgi:cytochrome P450
MNMFSISGWDELDPGMTLLSATGTVATTLAVMYMIHLLIQRKLFIDKVNKLPGPPIIDKDCSNGHPWLANMGPILATLGTIPNNPESPQIIPFFVRWSKEYAASGIFRLWVFNPYRLPFARSNVTVIDPELIRQLLEPTMASRKLVKEERIFQIVVPLVGSSLLALPDNAEWKHQRKMTAPAFHQTVLDETCRITTHLLCNVIFPQWDKNPSRAKAVEVVELSTRLTLEVLGNVALSHPFGGLRAYEEDAHSDERKDDSLYDTYRALLLTLSKWVRLPPFANWLPTRENFQFRTHSRRLDSTIENIVKERLKKEIESEKQPGDPKGQQRTSKDLLSQLLLKDEDGYRLPFKYIHGNVRMFLFAGHDTTAATMSYALWELAKSTKIQQRLRQEVDELFESLPDGENPSCMQLMQLRYLDAVLKETLRLHAPAGVARTAIEDITLTKGDETYLIPKSTSVFMFPLYTQTSEEYWKDSKEFVPDRFFDLDPATVSSNRLKGKLAYLPFSIGPRNCLGQPLANVELKSILAHVVRRYMVKQNEAAVEPIPVLLLTIKPHSVLLDFERRPDVK